MSTSSNSSNTSLKGKRKKTIPPNANPLFTQWITEWKIEAAEKGWKSAHTYAKALKTIKMFPLPLASGKDCRLLQNFGDKICKMLDEKLAEHQRNQAKGSNSNSEACSKSNKERQLHPSMLQTVSRNTCSDGTKDDEFSGKKPALSSASWEASCSTKSILPDSGFESTSPSVHSEIVKNVPVPSCQAGGTSSNGMNKEIFFGLHTISDSDDSDIENLASPQQKKPRPTGTRGRPYVPAYKSGPYALILTLYRHMQDTEFKGYLTKSELSHAAQPFCDKSFTVPDAGSRYTAWSSMGTLIKKGFISKASNPARYSLTADGYQLGERLHAAEIQDKDTGHHVSEQRSPNFASLKDVQGNSRERGNSGSTLSRNRFFEFINPSHLQSRSSDSEDDEMGRAGTNSLLSYSQEYSKRSLDQSALNRIAGKTYHSTDQHNGDVAASDLSRILNESLEINSSRSLSPVNDNDHVILIMSDEDEPQPLGQVYPRKTWAQYHTLSPTQSSPPRTHLPQSPSTKTSFPEEGTFPAPASFLGSLASFSEKDASLAPASVLRSITSDLSQNNVKSASNKLPVFTENMQSECNQDILEIINSSDEDISNANPKVHENCMEIVTNNNLYTSKVAVKEQKDISFRSFNKNGNGCYILQNNRDIKYTHSKYSEGANKVGVQNENGTTNNFNDADDDDDELPDLVMPLSTRLLQKGHIQSDLLKSLSTSTSATEPPVSKNVVCVIDEQAGYSEDAHGECSNNFTKLNTKSSCSSSHSSASVNDRPLDSTTSDHCCNPNTLNPLRGYFYCSSSSGTSSSSSGYSSNSSCGISSSSSSGFSNSRQQPSINTCLDFDTAAVDRMALKRNMAERDPSQYPHHMQPLSTSSFAAAASSTSSFAAAASSTSSFAAAASSGVTLCPIFTFTPGSFDIILCLDNREFYGGKGSSKTLLPELMKCGIQCDLRLLHVGDLLWIARERTEPNTNSCCRELVLHYIIERKRMDDLVSSMTDGRLKEQKFRLKHCGLSEPIILIEEYGSIQNFSISEDRIKQSIVNSQIIDGFKVKRCGSSRDAVTYLVTMTHFLQQHYSTKTLHAVSLDHLKLLKGQQSLHKIEHYLIPFDVFNEASVKHKDLTVKELFAKQLIQVPGISADRAKAITNVHPSFSGLMAAYERCADDKERQRLLSQIKCGKKERNLGAVLSQLLCMLYTQKGALL